MSKIKVLFEHKGHSTVVTVVILVILLTPSYMTLLKPGMFMMHDLHIFRLWEFEKCIADLIIPCRWSYDAAYGYGQPLFIFYGQAAYLFSEIFRVMGFSIIDSVKMMFASSFLLSGLAMFVLGKQIWKSNLGGLVTSIVYTYAPYRSIDVYTRGALPESLAFIYYPLIVYFFSIYILNRQIRSLLWFVLFYSLLIATHNLSAFIFSIFFLVWIVYFLTVNKAWGVALPLLAGFLMIAGLSAWYILPVLFEANLTYINQLANGYSEYFLTWEKILFAMSWDYYSLKTIPIGVIQWTIPLGCLVYLLVTRRLSKSLNFMAMLIAGFVSMLLTTAQTDFIWHNFVYLMYVQFPWRFFGLAVFLLALSVGVITGLTKNSKVVYGLSIAIIIATLLINFRYFKEYQWYVESDQQHLAYNYDHYIANNVIDFWPRFATKFPTKDSDTSATFLQGSGQIETINKISYKVNLLNSSQAEVQFPIVYFPGWRAFSESRELLIYPKSDLGLITSKITPQDKEIHLVFTNTFIRNLGQILASVSIVVWLIIFLKPKIVPSVVSRYKSN